MRTLGLGIAALAISASASSARAPDMTCSAQSSVVGGPSWASASREQEVTDVFRMQGGRLSHRWRGREESLCNEVREARPCTRPGWNVLEGDGRTWWLTELALSTRMHWPFAVPLLRPNAKCRHHQRGDASQLEK